MGTTTVSDSTVNLVRVSLSHSIQCQTHLGAAAIEAGAVAFVVIAEAAAEAEADRLGMGVLAEVVFVVIDLEVVASKAFRYTRKISQRSTLTLQ